MSESEQPGYVPNEETIQRIQVNLGIQRESVLQMPEMRLARVLHKLETQDRPRARMQHEREALLNDEGVIPVSSRRHALDQLRTLQLQRASMPGSVAGLPVGRTLPRGIGPIEMALAGLNPDNTGWTELGPGNIGGRTRAIVIHPTNTNLIYAAGVGGGVWRSTDAGGSWTPTDDLMANLAVCSLVMDPTDPHTLYAGTGEGFFNVDALRGDGIFRTTDGGVTWTVLGATQGNGDFFYVNALAISSNGQTLLAGTNEGIFRSADAGATWNQVLTVPIGNLLFDLGNSSKAIAGGRANGLAYWSSDGGQTWQQATRPTNVTGRVQVCYAAADSSTVYASVEDAAGERSLIWRSTDGGQTYSSRNATSGGLPVNYLGTQGWYDNVIWAGDPTDADLVIVGGIDLWRSTNGGSTLRPISTWWSDESAHADHHAIVSDPGYNGTSNRRVYFGNDGGIWRANDVTTVGNNASEPYTNGWEVLNNGYGVTQFYYADGHIGTNTIIGGAQDNGTLCFTPSQGANRWSPVWGGDGGDIASDPSDPQVWYGEYICLQIFRDTSGGTGGAYAGDYICGRYWDGFQWTWKPEPFTIPDARDRRAEFIAPFELDPNEPNRILGGGVSLWRTNDAKAPVSDFPPAGPRWEAIKASIGNAITALAIAHGNSDVVVVGHGNGNIYRSTNATDANPTWEQIDTNGINANRNCLALTIDPDDHDLIYAAFGGYQSDNLWRTNDGGQTWTDISSSLPDVPIRDIVIHPQRSTWLYLATDVGVFGSEDGGATWSPTNEGPANVACRDFFWMGTKLVCVTHGRGVFETDLAIANAFPNPVLAYTGREDYTVNGHPFTRYRLSVTNWSDYPNSLFFPSPDLPPCGSNANASRTWVDIYNGDNDERLYGFCAFDSADDLQGLWFALPQGETPPSSVYVVLRDRRCSANYTSNHEHIDLGPFTLELWSHRWIFGRTLIRARLRNAVGGLMQPANGAEVRLELDAPGRPPVNLGAMRWHRGWRSFYFSLRSQPPGTRVRARAFFGGHQVDQAELVLT